MPIERLSFGRIELNITFPDSIDQPVIDRICNKIRNAVDRNAIIIKVNTLPSRVGVEIITKIDRGIVNLQNRVASIDLYGIGKTEEEERDRIVELLKKWGDAVKQLNCIAEKIACEFNLPYVPPRALRISENIEKEEGDA